MKFVPCEIGKTQVVQDISSDEEHHDTKEKLKQQKKSFTSKPLIIRVPFISIMIEEETQPKKFTNTNQVINIQDSDSEDLYIIPTRNPALTFSPQCKPKPNSQSKQKTETCTICLLDIKLPAAKICCGHIFCGQCIIQSSKMSNKCPNCRARFKKIIIGAKIVKVKNKSLEQQLNFDQQPCYVCGQNDRIDQLLVCDHCEFAFCHVGCDNRLQGKFPQGDWYCLDCTMMGRHIS